MRQAQPHRRHPTRFRSRRQRSGLSLLLERRTRRRGQTLRRSNSASVSPYRNIIRTEIALLIRSDGSTERTQTVPERAGSAAGYGFGEQLIDQKPRPLSQYPNSHTFSKIREPI